MPADRFLGALLPLLYLIAVLVLSAVGAVWVVRQERRNPTSYSRRPDVLGSWRGLSTADQQEVDNAVLDAQEAVEEESRRTAGPAVEEGTGVNVVDRF